MCIQHGSLITLDFTIIKHEIQFVNIEKKLRVVNSSRKIFLLRKSAKYVKIFLYFLGILSISVNRRLIQLNNKLKTRFICFLFFIIMLLTACGEDPELSRFRQSMEDFCTKISEIDTNINNINAQSDNAATELLAYLDDLDMVFQNFAELDFPEEFNYLEDLADESSQYMTEAVKYYHQTYNDNSYDEYAAEYARQYYSRAYKRVQIIITFLHGETPNDADLTIEYNQ